jgi:NAD-dependent SIR2 family protein deacetylase
MQMLEKTVKFLKDSHVLVVGAGAGMGCDSGLPDFRGNEGFWNKYPPYRGKFNFY